MQQLVIIGGTNGSGKTTLAREFVELEHFTYLGADEIARELNPDQPETAAIAAARLFSQRFSELIEKKESLIVESTLSGLSLRKWIEKARKFGYNVNILFVYLDSPDLCVQRVAARVAKGGHHVPEDDIRRRYARSNDNFWHTYRDLANGWRLFFNAGNNIVQVAGGDRNGVMIVDGARFEQWQRMVTK
jgi:predicted ABC-type ATPase